MNRYICILVLIMALLGFDAHAQQPSPVDTFLTSVNLPQCIQYALKHQPQVKQAQNEEEIAETEIRMRLADWYPQVNAAFDIIHYFQLPTAIFPDANGNKRPIKTGVANNSALGISASQNIFNRDALLASRTAPDILRSVRERTIATRIEVVVNVSKAYYDVLVTQRQVLVLDEDIVRLQRSVQDTYNQYVAGTVDKIDYKRAQVSLNNTQADRRKAEETIPGKMSYLKQLMGYPAQNVLTLVYDSLEMERDVPFDTTQTVNLNNRVEFQILQTERRLLEANLRYQRLGYLPNISAIGSYTPNFLSSNFSGLYANMYPTSYIGLQLSLPIFQGGRRIQAVRNARLQLTREQLEVDSLTLAVNTQFSQALGAYKGSLAELNSLRENLSLARDVYNTLNLQYRAGIKTYLDVITSETDLRTAELNYLNYLFTVLSNKYDLERALGTVQY